jgi:hypothetical protein
MAFFGINKLRSAERLRYFSDVMRPRQDRSLSLISKFASDNVRRFETKAPPGRPCDGLVLPECRHS